MSEFKSIPPSWFVRKTRTYRKWCSITVCSGCGTRGKYEDAHPVNPCEECGDRVYGRVGRWVVIPNTGFLGFLKAERGYWQLKEEAH